MAGVDSAGSSLIQAVKIGNLEQVNRLIKFGASVNAVDENGQTALMIVAGPLLVFYRSFIPEMAISLMNGGADVNMKDKGGKTALMYAIANSNENTALAIMENGKDLDLNAVDNQGQTALMKAAIKGMTRIVIALIKRGVDVNMKDKEGKTALMHAIAQTDEGTALAIIEHCKDLDLNAVDNQGQTALMKAAIECWMTRKVIALIKRGVDVNMKDKEGKTALMHAIAQIYEGIALAIIEHCKDLDLNAVDNQGQTALMKAALHSKTKVAYALIKRDADINMKDKEGKTALTCAIDYKRDDIAAALISEINNDFSVNSVDNQGTTALTKAIIDGMTRFAIALIKRGAYVNVKDKKGKTAFMHAIAQRYEETALAIIEHSKELDLNAVDNQGRTALMYAIVAQRDEDIALAIIEHSTDLDLNAVDNQGQTAFMKSAFEGRTTIVYALITRGSDVNIKDKKGQTALMYAIVAQRDEDTALAIIEHSENLDSNAVDNQGQTALMKAIILKKTKVARALIRCGADVNKMDNKGRVALMYIALADSSLDAGLLTHELINAGADVKKADEEGNTALMYNVKHEASVKGLIDKAKAPVDSKNNIGRTALFFALVESISSARYLVENGANLHLTDNYNVSVLSYFIHHCIYKGGTYDELMEEKLALLKDNGVKKETIVNTIVNAVFCKLPLLKRPLNSLAITSISSFLDYAAKLSRKSFVMKGNKCRKFQNFADWIRKHKYYGTVADLSRDLDTLLELGANPNANDEQGNTIAHHISLLGIYNNADEAKKVFHVLLCLEEKGLKINQAKWNKETPFLFMLTNGIYHDVKMLNMVGILMMCKFFLEKDPEIGKNTTQSGDSVFHLLIKLSNKGDTNDESFERCMLELLEIFSHPQLKLGPSVNGANVEMNTPLHVWAAGSQPKSTAGKPKLSASKRFTWQGPSEKILEQLLRCGAVHHAKNLKGETPLHMCRTWAATKLLAKVGASTTDVDALGRSPLLSAAKNCLFLENPSCFYPDVPPDETRTFWETVLDMGFDLWTCDKNGDSIISILIKEKSFELADGLIEIACKNGQSLSNKTLVGVLNAICKDESTQTTWKSILVNKLLKQLKSTRRSLDMSLPLRSCCMNIIIHCGTKMQQKETTELDSVHYEIAKQLLRYGASGESCLDVAEGCPPLHALLSTTISMEERPFVIPWTSCSKKHKNQLAEVARGLNCNFQEPFWYHYKEIGRGAFGQVFVGIHGKDSMEVAVKRIQYTQQNREEDIREIRSFASLPKCEHIVRYLTFFQTADYSYIIMELMEGDLDGYFSSNVSDQKQTKVFCRDVAQGLKYLHEQNIIHRDLKPTNILYKTDPQLCLKIADFGLSRHIDINATFTVMATGVGTRGWIAPEVMKSTAHEHSTSSDVFSCALVFHYILSKDHRNPFSPADCTAKSELEIIPKTETNILNNNMEGWDSGLDPEASHVITGMLNCTNEKERPTAPMLLDHPMFWSKKKKLDFLSAVGNQEEFECPRAKRTVPLTMVEQDLENVFATIVKSCTWDDPRYTQTSVIFIEMQKPIVKHDKKGKPYNVPARKYDIGSAVELVRFIRNAIAHVASLPPTLQTQILDAVFLEEFPNLVIEVFKVVTEHGWNVSREEIKHVLAND